MTDIVIFGTGGFGRELHQIVEDIQKSDNSLHFLGFLDGNKAARGTELHGFPVLGDLGWLEEHKQVKIGMGIGSSAVRRKFMQQVDGLGGEYITLIHPTAHIGNRIEIGAGSTISARAILSTDIVVGRGVIINLNCTVGHETVLHDYVTVAPAANISGNVTVGEGTDLGTNSAVNQGVTLGEWSIIGTGTVVNKNVPANVTAVGIPAKVIKERSAGWHQL